MKGTDKVDSQKLVPRVEMSRARWDSFKVRGAMFKGDVQNEFCRQSLVDTSNMLSGVVVEADVSGTQ